MTFYEAVNLKNQKFSVPVDKSYVLGCTNFVGDVPDEIKYALVNTVEMNVSQALFNFLANSGGFINVVCENSVEHYASEMAISYYSEQGAVVGLTNIDFLSDEQGNVVINSANIFITAENIQIIPVLFTNIFDWCQKYESNQHGFAYQQGYPYGQQVQPNMPFISANNNFQAVNHGGAGHAQQQGDPYAQPEKTNKQTMPSGNNDIFSNAMSVVKEDFKETFIEDEPSLIMNLAHSAVNGYIEGYNEVMEMAGKSGLAAPHGSGGTSQTINKYDRTIAQRVKNAGSMPQINSYAQPKKATKQSAPSGNNSISNAMSVVKEDFKETFITDKNEKSLISTLADSAKAGFKEGFAKAKMFFGNS